MTSITDIRNSTTLRYTTEKKISTHSEKATYPVDVSEVSETMALAEEAAYQASEVDEQKVEDIKKAIANGELSIDYDRLAQKMLDFELTLFDE